MLNVIVTISYSAANKETTESLLVLHLKESFCSIFIMFPLAPVRNMCGRRNIIQTVQ